MDGGSPSTTHEYIQLNLLREEREIPALLMSRGIETEGRDITSPSKRSWLSSISRVMPGSMRGLVLLLHVLLVLVNIALLLVFLDHHLEHNIVVSLGEDANVLSESISIVSQTIAVVYFAMMVTTVQQISTRRNFVATQTLTATHDNLSAWTSLGSALSTLLQQRTIPASALGVTAITLYLGGISALHVTTASLFTVQSFNKSFPVTVEGTLALQDLCSSVWALDGSCNLTTSFSQQSMFIPVFDIFSSSPGLIGNTIYDMLEANIAVGTVSVNATSFTVDCGTVPQAILTNVCVSSTGTYFNEDNSTNSCVQINPGENGLHAPVCLLPDELPLSTVRTEWSVDPSLTTDNQTDYAALGSTAFIYSTINVTDSNGNVGTLLSFDPPWEEPFENGNITVYSLNVIACALSETNHTIQVDAQTKFPVEPSYPNGYGVKTSSTWKPWVLQEKEGSDIINRFRQIFSTSVGTEDSPGAFYVDAGPGSNYVDWYIVKDTVNGSLSLSHLENSLANITAMMYWATVQTELNSTSRAMNEVEASNEVAFARVNINAVQLIISTVVSFLLLPLACYLIGIIERSSGNGFRAIPNRDVPADEVDSISSAGILQLLWLLHNDPTAQTRLSETLNRILEGERFQTDSNVGVHELNPTLNQLRAAGMFEVRLAGKGRYEEDDEDGNQKARLDVTP